MTLRLVEKDNVVSFPGSVLADVAAAARGFADTVEAGLAVETAIIVSKVDGRIEFAVLGADISVIEGLGILEVIKNQIVNGGH